MTNFLSRLNRQWRRFSHTHAVGHIAVDVIVPACNAERTIQETLSSIAAQTHPNFCCWVVDDHSSDSTATVVDRFAQQDGRFVLVSNRSRLRVAAARNIGVAQGRHPWVAFCDADDTWEPTKLQRQLRLLVNQGAEVALSAVNVCYPSVGSYSAGRLIRPRHFRTSTLVSRLLSFNMAICGSNLLVSRSRLTQLGGFDAAIDPSDDYDILLRLAYNGVRFAFDPRATVNYNRNLGSITQQEIPRTTYYHDQCVERWKKKAGVSDDVYRVWAEKLNSKLFVQPSREENRRLPIGSPKFSARVYSKSDFFAD